MSLSINVGKVAAVLLADGNWHTVKEGSFTLAAYEFEKGQETVFGGGSSPLIPTTGAKWTDTDGTVYFCPLTAIMAVRYAGPGATTVPVAWG